MCLFNALKVDGFVYVRDRFHFFMIKELSLCY